MLIHTNISLLLRTTNLPSKGAKTADRYFCETYHQLVSEKVLRDLGLKNKCLFEITCIKRVTDFQLETKSFGSHMKTLF